MILLVKKKWLKQSIKKAIFPGIQGGPLNCCYLLHKGLPFSEALQPEFKVYAQQVIDNAKR